ncbi:Phorbol-ester/DAG-type domain-containing protein [Caenorhabditis elegans]|uniref:Phorbol-ester/DAG-type domain-containing protein n=1 Tax=Caenorhabditis elegans TaxID=6239 RepID=P91501_CAEEL|nr:Phorbol-ester/DAG-type domain-containing protein [Caenorhabditis elegans]CCD72007.1 Phorbol-ester/DAG-type domain-containing protein [Caenorhabditis elegans]|eukprot:NP_491764.1 Uncharacterized protein CELE_T27A3.7 [Caenorhabditis elegans]
MSDDGSDTSFEEPHGDFDYTLLFEKFNKEVPKMEEVMKAAKKFGASHRHLINKFILEPSMSAKKMNLMFAKHLTTAIWKRHPDTVMQIQTNREEARQLSKLIVKTMNDDEGKGPKPFRPWRFVISTDEKSPTEFVTMTGCGRNSSVISEASDLTKVERALLLVILEEMISSDGTVQMDWVHSQIRHEPCKMPGPKCDIFMAKMMRQRYFLMTDENEVAEITPRILVELEPWLRAKFTGDLKTCELCRKIISRSVYTAECQKCHALCHFNCFKNATIISHQDNVECQKCNQNLSLNEVLKQIDTKKATGVPRSRDTVARSPSPDSDVPKAPSRTQRAKSKSKTPAPVDSDDDMTITPRPTRGKRNQRVPDSDSE